MVNKHHVKLVFSLDDHKRLVSFVELLITIDRRVAPVRDKADRFTSSPKSKT